MAASVMIESIDINIQEGENFKVIWQVVYT